MSAPVDVLAVMDSVLDGQQTHSEIIEARAAVAELVEAANRLSTAKPGWRCEVIDFNPAGVSCFSPERKKAMADLRAALAKFGGGQ